MEALIVHYTAPGFVSHIKVSSSKNTSLVYLHTLPVCAQGLFRLTNPVTEDDYAHAWCIPYN